MLTPNKIREKKSEIKSYVSRGQLGKTLIDPLVTEQSLMQELYLLVLHEIAEGSIDAKSLALTVLER